MIFTFSIVRMPKKTKQYGWQCSECDKDPSLQPSLQHTPDIDLEAPRSSRARGQQSRVNSIILSDSDAESIRNFQVEASMTETPVRKPSKKKSKQVANAPVESTPAPQPCDIPSPPLICENSASKPLANKPEIPKSSSMASETPTTPSTPAETPVKRKRGRPVGWRKYKDGEAPPPKSRKKKPKESLDSSVTSQDTPTKSVVRVNEPEDRLMTSPILEKVIKVNDQESPLKKDNDVPHSLPPKKFFKSKAAQKEHAASPPEKRTSLSPNPENERTNFRNWLDAKLSPIKGVNSSDIPSSEQPNTNGVGTEGNNPTFCPPLHDMEDKGRGVN